VGTTIRSLAVLLLLGCSRPQVAPDDKTLPQPTRGPCPTSPEPLLYVRVPLTVDLETGGRLYCDPLASVLEAASAGTVTGPSALTLGNDDSLGCGVRPEDADRALTIVRKKLRELGAPKRTVVEELCEGVGSVHTVW
jgi:hypothetical protein